MANVNLENTSDGTRCFIRIQVNGVTKLKGTYDSGSGRDLTPNVIGLLSLSKGDKVNAWINHNEGVDLSTGGVEEEVYCGLVKLG